MSDTAPATPARRGPNLVRSFKNLLEWLLLVAIYLACGGALYVWLYGEPPHLGVIWFWSFILIWPFAIFFKFLLYVVAIILIVVVLFLVLYGMFGET